jgi:hypothetical protein
MGLAAQAARRDARLVQIEVPSGETATLALKTSTQAGKEDMARSSAQTVAGKSRKED